MCGAYDGHGFYMNRAANLPGNPLASYGDDLWHWTPPEHNSGVDCYDRFSREFDVSDCYDRYRDHQSSAIKSGINRVFVATTAWNPCHGQNGYTWSQKGSVLSGQGCRDGASVFPNSDAPVQPATLPLCWLGVSTQSRDY